MVSKQPADIRRIILDCDRRATSYFFMCFQLIQTILHQNHRVEFQALHLSRRLSLDMEIRLQYDPSPSTNARGSTTT